MAQSNAEGVAPADAVVRAARHEGGRRARRLSLFLLSWCERRDGTGLSAAWPNRRDAVHRVRPQESAGAGACGSLIHTEEIACCKMRRDAHRVTLIVPRFISVARLQARRSLRHGNGHRPD